MRQGNNENGNGHKPLNDSDPDPGQGSDQGQSGGTGDTGEGMAPANGMDGPGDGMEPASGTGGPVDDGRVRGTDGSDTDRGRFDGGAPEDDDPESGGSDSDDPDDLSDDEPAAGRKWIRNTVIVLLVAALFGNILAFWPQIFNMETMPLLFQSRELSGREEIQHYKQAVVLVVTDKGKGTGFHISDGYIATNHHVIEDAGYAIVEFPDINARFAADVAGFDPDLDIALLRVDSGDKRLPSIEIEREREWEPGERIYVIGNPLYLKQIAIEGTVLGTLPIQGRRTPVMAVDAPVHKGNSGSPVINERGRAIAVIYATGEMTDQGKVRQVGLAVPIRELDGLLRDLPPPGSEAGFGADDDG